MEVERARRGMVERQLRARGIADARVLEAMASVPRERFVPPGVRARAYSDRALPIGAGQTVSQPWIVAAMISLLDLDGSERVLEVGTGSGYAAAVLSRCTREVVTVERREDLAGRSRDTLRALGYHNVEVRHGDGSLGAPDAAPFGGIVVTAAAAGQPPRALFEQRAPGAALVCPVQGDDGEWLTLYRGSGPPTKVVAVRFVPLVPGDPAGANEEP